VGGVTIQNGSVSSLDLSGVVQNNNLSSEFRNFSGGVVFVVRSDVSSSNIFNRDTFNVESNVVSGGGFGHLFVVHFDGFNFGGDTRRSEANLHTGSDDSGFNSSDGDCSDSSDFVNIL